MRGERAATGSSTLGRGSTRSRGRFGPSSLKERHMSRVGYSLSVLFYTADCRAGDWEVLDMLRSLE